MLTNNFVLYGGCERLLGRVVSCVYDCHEGHNSHEVHQTEKLRYLTSPMTLVI